MSLLTLFALWEFDLVRCCVLNFGKYHIPSKFYLLGGRNRGGEVEGLLKALCFQSFN